MLCDKAPLKCLWLAQRCVQDDLQPHGHAFSSWSSCCADECKTENGQIGLVNLGLQCIAILNNDNVGEHCFLSATFNDGRCFAQSFAHPCSSNHSSSV